MSDAIFFVSGHIKLEITPFIIATAAVRLKFILCIKKYYYSGVKRGHFLSVLG